jgi:hypothetical protein
VQFAAAEGRFDEALRLAQTWLTEAPVTSQSFEEAFMLAPTIEDVEHILGRSSGYMEAALDRYFYAEPPVATAVQGPSKLGLVLACTAIPPQAGSRCIHRFKELLHRGVLILGTRDEVDGLEGASRYVEGDLAGAAKSWRPVAAAGGPVAATLREPMIAAFEQSGEPDLAAKVDEAVLANLGFYGGADLFRVREAERAERRGDRERAKKLVQEVIDAWSAADETIPAVAEMHAQLDRQR